MLSHSVRALHGSMGYFTKWCMATSCLLMLKRYHRLPEMNLHLMHIVGLFRQYLLGWIKWHWNRSMLAATCIWFPRWYSVDASVSILFLREDPCSCCHHDEASNSTFALIPLWDMMNHSIGEVINDILYHILRAKSSHFWLILCKSDLPGLDLSISNRVPFQPLCCWD